MTGHDGHDDRDGIAGKNEDRFEDEEEEESKLRTILKVYDRFKTTADQDETVFN